MIAQRFLKLSGKNKSSNLYCQALCQCWDIISMLSHFTILPQTLFSVCTEIQARSQRLVISHVFPGHAYSFVQEYTAFQISRNMFKLSKTSYRHHISLILLLGFWSGSYLSVTLNNHFFFFFFDKCPRDRDSFAIGVLSQVK